MSIQIFLGQSSLVFCDSIFAIVDELASFSDPLVIITDHYVRDLFGSAIEERLREKKKSIFLLSLPPGEDSKSRQMKEYVEDQLFSLSFPKSGAIVALGGGIISDLAGFVASTYMRGVSFYSIPTTLLAMVDASLGGKTAVNTPFGKNLIGSMYFAKKIWICTQFLSTLPEREWKNGLAEIIKLGFVFDPEMLSLAVKGVDKTLIFRACLGKKSIVEQDAGDQGIRRVLQFGHTMGHALEKVSDYKMSHGESVAIGMAFEGYLSYVLGFLSERNWREMQNILHTCHFSLGLNPQWSFQDIQKFLALDKKAQENRCRFVLLENMGKAASFQGEYCTYIDNKDIKKAWEFFQSCPI